MTAAQKKLEIDSAAIKNAASIYRAIYHPLRLQIIETIHHAGEINVTPLIRKFKLEQSLISLQLRILREINVLKTKREGRIIYYSINYDQVNFILKLTDKLVPRQANAGVYPDIDKSSLSKFSKAETMRFSSTELRVIRMVCEQKTSDEIAKELDLSKRTIEDYRASILKKTESKNSVGILIYAIKNGLFKI
jgi:DNA-binding CsgD family transcriptional regulator